MKLMQSMVRVATGIADKEIAKMVNLAVTVRDDPKLSARDRMRAVELLNAMIAKGIDVAQYIDKTERLDSGKPTENVGVKLLKVEFDE